MSNTKIQTQTSLASNLQIHTSITYSLLGDESVQLYIVFPSSTSFYSLKFHIFHYIFSFPLHILCPSHVTFLSSYENYDLKTSICDVLVPPKTCITWEFLLACWYMGRVFNVSASFFTNIPFFNETAYLIS